MDRASGKPISNGGDNFESIYPGVSQKLAFNASAQSAALGAKTSMVQLTSTQDCHLAFGANPTAVADGTGMFLPKGLIVRVGVGPATKIAAIKDSSAGNLFITEGA